MALLGARLVLAAVFALAGLTKLADHQGARQAMRDFGVPAALATAVALLPTASAWWGAAGALALLALFIVGIGVSLARGRRPDCHCFGQIAAGPIGWGTLVRNAVLAAVAGFILAQGPDDAGASAVA